MKEVVLVVGSTFLIINKHINLEASMAKSVNALDLCDNESWFESWLDKEIFCKPTFHFSEILICNKSSIDHTFTREYQNMKCN